MVHPLDVTLILADMQMDMVCLQTGLLHDVVEDTGVGIEELQKKFGEEVARCVDGVTKISKLNLIRARTGRPRACARCCSPWSTTSASSW